MYSLKNLFSLELNKARTLVKKIYTSKHSLAELPEALQHFVLQSGFNVHGDIQEAKVEWNDAKLKLSQKGNWKSISCVQHNFLPEPIRIAYMKTKLFNLFGLEGFDSFLNGNGYMAIRLVNLFDLARAKGPEMDNAELVTILAETMIIPSYVLQTYIHWKEISRYVIKGTINYNNLSVSGIFYLNRNFEMIKFETSDRYFTDKNGIFHPVKWTAECNSYINRSGLRFPTLFTATWNFTHSDFCYFQAKIKSININPNA